MDLRFALLLLVLTGSDGAHIVGGRESAPHSRPYMALLKKGGQLNCGGVLVREDFLLTAAHCWIPQPYTVIVGSDSLSGNESTKQEFRSVRSFRHPDYDGHENDIMLLKLSGTAQLTEAVQIISLRRGALTPFSKCLTAGWGDIGDNSTFAARLQEVNVTTLSQSLCQKRWQKVPITRTMVCGVGNANFQGFCSGDSGGPLVCDGAAAGVISFSGSQCGNSMTPDVYTLVSSFIDWITSVLNSN